eukprot:168648-Amphidinium_carterae.1
MTRVVPNPFAQKARVRLVARRFAHSTWPRSVPGAWRLGGLWKLARRPLSFKPKRAWLCVHALAEEKRRLSIVARIWSANLCHEMHLFIYMKVSSTHLSSLGLIPLESTRHRGYVIVAARSGPSLL